MADRSRTSQLRPRLERTSHTLIDLTDDADVEIATIPRARSHASMSRPPQLGRSDIQSLRDVIDLTDDDVLITGANHPPPAPRREPAEPPRRVHPSFFSRDQSPPLAFMGRHLPPPVQDADSGLAHGLGVVMGGAFHNMGLRFHELLHGDDPGAAFEHIMQNHMPAMPGPMDYGRHAFADRKPDHVPPEKAKPGFTRSPVENDIVICPLCEEELVHRKDVGLNSKSDDGPAVKRRGRAPTKRDREEHPFWVIKECGHVSMLLYDYDPLLMML
jgi:hypothetical protein